jgi:hypothetical protein
MEENENVVEETTQETSKVDESKFESAGDDSVIKVDLNAPVENETNEEDQAKDDGADEARVVGSNESADTIEKQEEVQEESETQESPVLEEVVDEEVEEVVEQVEEAIAQAEATGKPLPENIQKLVDFMEETGGDINDYVRLNKDYSQMDGDEALKEYYRLTKPHLDSDERSFLLNENFSFDEDVDDERDIRKKKIAYKEQVAEAKAYLDGQKSKYYDEIKAGSKLTAEQQKALDFFNRYNKESEASQALQSTFLKKTDSVFTDKFKGFEYNVGEKKYRFNVKDATKVKETQSDINNFVKKFLNEDGTMSDAKGYHKALYSAMNSDAIAQHFYEQGKADALKQSVAKSKNVDMTPRQNHKEFESGGIKVRVLGDNSSDFKFKINKRK